MITIKCAECEKLLCEAKDYINLSKKIKNDKIEIFCSSRLVIDREGYFPSDEFFVFICKECFEESFPMIMEAVNEYENENEIDIFRDYENEG